MNFLKHITQYLEKQISKEFQTVINVIVVVRLYNEVTKNMFFDSEWG